MYKTLVNNGIPTTNLKTSEFWPGFLVAINSFPTRWLRRDHPPSVGFARLRSLSSSSERLSLLKAPQAKLGSSFGTGKRLERHPGNFNAWNLKGLPGIIINYIHVGISKNRGTPKCMVYNGKPFKMDNLGVPPCKETSIWLSIYQTCMQIHCHFLIDLS